MSVQTLLSHLGEDLSLFIVKLASETVSIAISSQWVTAGLTMILLWNQRCVWFIFALKFHSKKQTMQIVGSITISYSGLL
jgi:hypothetical protein